MRKILIGAALLGALSLSACDMDSGDDHYDHTPGGSGMTYNGKLGIDMGNGFVMGYDGQIQPGFGF